MKKRTIISLILTAGAMFGTYKLWHHASVLIFISLLILSFLLAYKITDYIADFKTLKQQSRIEIVFLVVFFILLFIPMSYINPAEKAKGENRYLAKWPSLMTEKGRLNYNIGKNVNEWFSDRFLGRRELIPIKTLLYCSLNKTCETKTGKLYKQYNIVTDSAYFGITSKSQYKDSDKFIYAENLQKFSDYCDKNNIKLYVLIVPRRSEFFDYKLFDTNVIESDKAEDVIEYIRENTNVKLVFPKSAMLEANKQTPVFYKTDHHWTKKGSYIGYYELMKEIKKDFPYVKILEEKSFTPYYDKRVKYWWNSKFSDGQGLEHLKLPKFINKKILDTDYLYYKNPESSKLQTDKFTNMEGLCGYDEEFYYPDGSNLRTMLIANSFGRNLVEFLPYSFKHTIRFYDNYRHLKFETYKPFITEYKPDIVVLNFSTIYMPVLLKMYDKNEEK